MQFFPGIGALAPLYDALILDLWGVVHDGQALYPNARETLITLRNNGKQILFLSNAPRRSSRVIEGLERMGIDESLYDGVVSSGEVAHAFLIRYMVGKRYVYVGLERDAGLLADLDYRLVKEPTEADFILNAGLERDEQEVSDFLPWLERCVAAGLPMICINPDIEIVRLSGQRVWCAGALAKAYEELGGSVMHYGKPYPDVYETCFEKLKPLGKSRILAIGDNLDTDILGARQMNIACALVAGGILSAELDLGNWNDATHEMVRSHCTRHGSIPNFVIPALKW